MHFFLYIITVIYKTTFVFLCAPQALNTKRFWKPAADWAPLRHTLVWARSPAGSREAGRQTPILRNAPSTVRSAMCGSTQNCSSNRWARVMVFMFHEMTVYVLLYAHHFAYILYALFVCSTYPVDGTGTEWQESQTPSWADTRSTGELTLR